VALRAFPLSFVIDFDFSIEATFVAVVRFCIKFCILDIIIDEFNHCLQSFKVFLHIGYFNVGDSTSRGDFLELGFKLQFGEGVDRFTDVNMVGIGVISFVGHVWDVSEAFFVDSRESVAERFGRSPVESKSESCFFFSGIGGCSQSLHHFESKCFACGVGVGDAFDEFGGFIDSDVSEGNRRVSAF
jgi:hypothetical protein